MTSIDVAPSLESLERAGHELDAFKEELLIKEARRATLRRRFRNGLIVAMVTGLIVALSLTGGNAKHPPTPSSRGDDKSPKSLPVLGGTVTDTSLGAGTAIESIDMVTSSFGYGLVANSPFQPRGAELLVTTTTGGNSWTLAGKLPETSYGSAGNEFIPSIHFVTRDVGYVTSDPGVGGSFDFVTLNGGHTWSRMHVPGAFPSWSFDGSTVAVITQRCRPNVYGHDCVNRLSMFRDGSTTPVSTFQILQLRGISARNIAPLALLTPTTFVALEGLPGGGGQNSATAMVMTINSGATWQRLSDPCPTEGEGDQLLSSRSDAWLLSCFVGEGMNQGKSSIWRSTNDGATWTVVNRANDSSSTRGDVGNGGGVATTILFSRNGLVMYGAMGGAIGGVEVSTDGGLRWTNAGLDGQGGASETVSTIGGAGAIDDIRDGLIYRTVNGHTWKVLPPLPAGTYRGMRICQSDDVVASIRSKHQHDARAHDLVFTNQGIASCYLDGTPRIQPVNGSERSPVGPLLQQVIAPTQNFVIVPGGGGTASVPLWIAGASSSTGYPKAQCQPHLADALVVRFNAPSTFAVSIPGGAKVCIRLATSTDGPVVAGPKGDLND